MKLKIGTRGSELALLQVQRVVRKLKSIVPELKEEIKIIKTAGDLRQKKTQPGMFVNEVNRAVLSGEVDIGVHSLKDLPTTLPGGLRLACVPERLAPNDVLVSRDGSRLRDLPPSSNIGTSSLRRRAEILHLRHDLKILDLRGNLMTRLRKVEDGFYDAIVIARAALERLNLLQKIAQEFKFEEIVPAAGQGAIGVVCKEDGSYDFLTRINDRRAWSEIICERAFLHELNIGCQASAGAVAKALGDRIELTAVVHVKGRCLLKLKGKNPEKVGVRAARILCSEAI
jgi:hydroxymethylbilane synthase